MNAENRERYLLMLAAICLGALLFDKLLLTPLYHHWNENSEQMQKIQLLLVKGDLLLSRERSLRKRWREMQRDALPKDVSGAESQVVKSVDRWVQESGIRVKSLKPQWRQHGEAEYVTLECSAVTQGTLPEIVRFLYQLETDPLALAIENLKINEPSGNHKQQSLHIRFSGLQLKEETK